MRSHVNVCYNSLKMTYATVLFALVTTFGQLIDGLSTDCSAFDFDITAQIALCNTNAPASIEIIGNRQAGEWRSLHLPVPPDDIAFLSSGDSVRIQGHFDFSKRGMPDPSPSPAFTITKVTSLGKRPFPPPRTMAGGEISVGLHLRSIVSAQGVLSSVIRDESNPHFIWLIVRTKTGQVRALTSDSDFPFPELVGMRDADVELTGLAEMAWAWRRFVGHHLLLFGREGLKTLAPPPDDPYAGPDLASNLSSLHRASTTGTIIGIGSRDVFIRQDGGKFLPVTLEDGVDPPCVGTHVMVAGFPAPDQNNTRLIEAVIRSTGRPQATPEPPRDLDVARLSAETKTGPRMSAEAYGHVIRFHGILNNPGTAANEASVLSVRCGPRTIPLDVAALRGQLDERLCGECEVEICGICSVIFEKDLSGTVFPEFKGIIVIPRTANDIRILRLPPWWTPTRFVWAVCILLALLLAILLWNSALRHAVIRKSTALLKEQVAKLEETLKIDERTRLAAELHDYLAQNLTVVSYRITAALNAFRKKREDTADYLDSADRMLRSCRTELRRCLWDLRNDTLDEPDFSRAVAKAVTPVSGKAALHVRFGVRRSRLSDSTAHAILSICRELVSNAVLHGHAESIRIAGEAKDGAINFSVRDDGCGFDPAARPGRAEGHFGLDGIAERVKRLDGAFSINSTPGKGTRITVTVKYGGMK